jgi:hypothetical protein
VHVPGAATTSTAASFPQRNYTIDAGSAWSRLVEVQGFGQRYVDASGVTLGTVTISANEITRFITVRVPKASLGTPGPGWGFTVVLTGQDGFSADQARGFQPTPQEFQFGVCATASADPHCTFAPNLVPKAVDVITPSGVANRPVSTIRSGRWSFRASRSRDRTVPGRVGPAPYLLRARAQRALTSSSHGRSVEGTRGDTCHRRQRCS